MNLEHSDVSGKDYYLLFGSRYECMATLRRVYSFRAIILTEELLESSGACNMSRQRLCHLEPPPSERY